MAGVVEDHPNFQTNVTKQPSFRWQLSDFLTLFAAFAFVTVDAVSPLQRWAKFATCAIIAWWMYRCIKAGRQPSGYHIAVLCVSVGIYVVLVGIIKRLMERGFS
jgi:hypothetical protein